MLKYLSFVHTFFNFFSASVFFFEIAVGNRNNVASVVEKDLFPAPTYNVSPAECRGLVGSWILDSGAAAAG